MAAIHERRLPKRHRLSRDAYDVHDVRALRNYFQACCFLACQLGHFLVRYCIRHAYR